MSIEERLAALERRADAQLERLRELIAFMQDYKPQVDAVNEAVLQAHNRIDRIENAAR